MLLGKELVNDLKKGIVEEFVSTLKNYLSVGMCVRINREVGRLASKDTVRSGLLNLNLISSLPFCVLESYLSKATGEDQILLKFHFIDAYIALYFNRKCKKEYLGYFSSFKLLELKRIADDLVNFLLEHQVCDDERKKITFENVVAQYIFLNLYESLEGRKVNDTIFEKWKAWMKLNRQYNLL